MSYLILIDEEALKDCVESNVYQSCQFEIGENLARCISGDRLVTTISPKIVPIWRKDVLYLLQSRVETGYLLLSSDIFASLNEKNQKAPELSSILNVFQKTCRFALKIWSSFNLAPSEKWISATDRGVVFPFNLAAQKTYRVVVRRGYGDPRVEKRHGKKHLFAYAGGHADNLREKDEAETLYKRAFEELGEIKSNIRVYLPDFDGLESDSGHHSLVLSDSIQEKIKFQLYDQWMGRLTMDQKRFVQSMDSGPLRVEGPAGTGKTLCLVLRSYFLCLEAVRSGVECHVLFVAHSEATRDAVNLVFDSMGGQGFHLKSRAANAQTIELCTLQQWCGSLLGERDITNAQFLDQDALSAKEMRRLMLVDIVIKMVNVDTGSLKYLSDDLNTFLTQESPEYVAELLQHEIGVVIKGRASQSLELYLELPFLNYCLPLKTVNDKRFVFTMYNEYQTELNSSGVFDTDDVTISTLGRLDTPIWRRRKSTEGYDSIIIDETHLFNLNELSVFHHLLKTNDARPIAFSIDRSQAPGERGITTRLVKEVLAGSDSQVTDNDGVRTNVVFRSSPSIVRFAEDITMAGATMFTTFENPLTDVTSVINATDEGVARTPKYWEVINDFEMCVGAVRRARELKNELKCPSNEILIVGITLQLLDELKSAFIRENFTYLEIVQRGDLEAVRKGGKNSFIVSHPDFVGGLEFKAVLIVGVDEGRVPPVSGIQMVESKHFASFKACSRLYVAITRARLIVELFYSKDRGVSSLLLNALDAGSIEKAVLV